METVKAEEAMETLLTVAGREQPITNVTVTEVVASEFSKLQRDTYFPSLRDLYTAEGELTTVGKNAGFAISL